MTLHTRFGRFAALLLMTLTAGSAWAKAKVHSGIECTYGSNLSYGSWTPIGDSLAGRDGIVVYCPVLTLPAEGYHAGRLNYGVIKGSNIQFARICRRTLSGSTTCGSFSRESSSSWRLSKPSGGSSTDALYVIVLVGAGASQVTDYTLYWND